MGKDALLRAMRKQARLELTELRHEAAEHHARLRKEYATRLRLARTEQRGRQRQAFRQTLHTEALRCAREQSQRLTEHRARLEGRLRHSAEIIIRTIWEEKREELLPHLLSDLPPLNWSRIRVAPEDLEIAKRLTSTAPFVSDPDIPGGLIAECAERDMISDATLNTLLTRLWPSLLPELLERISDECRQNIP